MEKYERYRDSGILGIGVIPDHWISSSIGKGLEDIKDGTHGTFERTLEGEMLLSAKNVFPDGLHISDNESCISISDYSNIISNGFPRYGDVLFCAVGTIGRVCYYEFEKSYAFQRSVAFLRPNFRMNGKFLFYFLQSPNLEDDEKLGANGTAQLGLYMGEITKLPLLIPPLHEQSAIADYLDRKVSRIDRIIEEARASIEEYKAWKSSIIYEAVTKGLDPTVEMKDSGVEWIGTVPKNWSVGNFGRFVSMIQTGPFGSQLHSDDYVEGGIPVINPANIQNGCIVVNEKNCITEEQANTLKQHLMQLHDIVFGRRGEMGRCACVIDTERQYFCGTGCIRIKCNELMNPIFAAHYLQMPKVKQYLELHSVGTTMANLNAGIISGIPILCPPIDEQEDICQLISNQSATIDSLISEKESLITDLEAYKKSLIFEVVTGKRKVV